MLYIVPLSIILARSYLRLHKTVQIFGSGFQIFYFLFFFHFFLDFFFSSFLQIFFMIFYVFYELMCMNFDVIVVFMFVLISFYLLVYRFPYVVYRVMVCLRYQISYFVLCKYDIVLLN